MRILIVEDETRLAETLRQLLEDQRYQVDTVYDGADGVDYGLAGQYDLIILDVMLPKVDGFQVAQRLRAAHVSTPILMLTARDDVSDKISGLDCGADDYMTKPFNPLELVARVKTQLRRYTTYNSVHVQPAEASYDFSGLYICRDSRKCSLYGRALSLTPLEFDILWYLCEHRGKVVSSEALFEAVWGEKYLDQNNTVMAHIARLRKKMGEPSRKPKFIKTVWGVGYTLG